uniref:Uncharacterized protein n=1 Tax=Anguilla anguilla TaxID=7936 RepID=A0A0E9QZF4_ANGAN
MQKKKSAVLSVVVLKVMRLFFPLK